MLQAGLHGQEKKICKFESFALILNIIDELPVMRAEEISTFLLPTISWYIIIIIMVPFSSVTIYSHHWVVSVLFI